MNTGPVDESALIRHYEEFDDQGFTIVPNVVSEPLLSRLKEQIETALALDWERYGGLPGKERFIALDLAHYGGAFFHLLDDDLIDQLMSGVIGDHWVLYSFTSTILRPREQHYTSNIHTDTGRLTPGYNLAALMTIALDDFTEENGATWYLAGSHRTHPDMPSEDEFYNKAVRVCRKAGDAVFFHPRVWHAGGHNDGDATRFALTMYGCRSFMKQRFDFPRMISPSQLEGASDRLRRVLGFDVRVPMGLDEFYVPPEDRLYRAGQG
jgi:ectoine hydroxylase-related dioxygenase (phytanoyl-CoA dioxygenase family)